MNDLSVIDLINHFIDEYRGLAIKNTNLTYPHEWSGWTMKKMKSQRYYALLSNLDKIINNNSYIKKK